MNKKAQFLDFLYIAYILFMVAILGILSQYIVTETEKSMNSSTEISSENLQLITNYKDRQVGMVDQLFLIALFGMSIVAVVSAFFVLSHPFFYILMALILGLMSWINAIYSNIYQEFASMTDLIVIADQFTFIPLVMRWFPLIMFVISILIAIVMTAKGKGGGY